MPQMTIGTFSKVTEEVKDKPGTNGGPMVTSHNHKQQMEDVNAVDVRKIKCYKCGKKGHKSFQCKAKVVDSSESSSEEETPRRKKKTEKNQAIGYESN